MTLIHEAVAAAARRYPAGVAFVDDAGREVFYHDLLRRTAAVARTVGARTRPGDRIAVVTRKEPDTVIAMLATLWAGRCYVPIDPAMPSTRRDFILRQAGCTLILATTTAVPDSVAVDVVDVTAELARAAGAPDAPGAPAGTALDDEAYVLFTSGSTGEPKGVVITHRNARAFVRWARAAFPLQPGDQVAVHAPLHFDLPVYDLYAGLAGGATLHLVPERTALFPQGLYRFLRDRAITHLYAVPSALAALLRRSTLDTDGLPALRQLLYAGEEFQPAALARWMRAVPQAKVSNLYGPIETNVVTRWTLPGPPATDRRVPLGHPVTGSRVALLDEDGNASERAPGEGEIVVAGDCVTPGYLARPDLTGRSMVELTTENGPGRFYRTGDFGRRDPDGVLWLLGRRDGLVKTRGYRVELGEIEVVLAAHPEVAEAAVLATPDAEITHRLHALVVATGNGSPDRVATELVAYCRQRLPGYMVPGNIHVVRDLPRTSTGKIARAELPALVEAFSGGSR